MNRNSTNRGEIPFEIFLLLALVLVASGLVFPLFYSAKISRNEEKAIEVLKELAQGISGNESNISFEELLPPPLGEGILSIEGELLEKGKLLKSHGYLFQIVPSLEEISIYAWPFVYSKTGNACFFYRSPNQFLESRNVRRHYSGLGHRPSEKAALRAMEKGEIYFGKDGQEWRKL